MMSQYRREMEERNDNLELIKSPFLRVGEVAKYLQIHEMTVYKYLREGILPGTKLGGQWVIHKDRLDENLWRLGDGR